MRQKCRFQRQNERNKMKNRVIILLIISFIYISTYDLLESIDGIFYYPACASVELITICALYRIKNKLSLHMQLISLALIVSHIFGMLLYINYYPPIIYQVVTYFLMILQCFRILWTGNNDNKNNNRWSLDHCNTVIRSR